MIFSSDYVTKKYFFLKGRNGDTYGWMELMKILSYWDKSGDQPE